MDAQLLALRIVGVNRVGALDADCGGRVADYLSCRSRVNYTDDSAFGVVGVVGLTPLHHTANRVVITHNVMFLFENRRKLKQKQSEGSNFLNLL
jgi:hypothetical protein